MTPRIMFTIMTNQFFHANVSVYTQKLQYDSFIDRSNNIQVRHPEQAYSMRTNYTVKSTERNELARKNRIQKKASLKYSVDETRSFRRSNNTIFILQVYIILIC